MTTVALFGPVTGAYGGSGVGGLATHGVEVAEALPRHGVRVTYLADNLRLHSPVSAPWGTLHGVAGARGRIEAWKTRLADPKGARAARMRIARDPELKIHEIPEARAFSRAWLIAQACRASKPAVLHVQQPDYRPLYARWADVGLPTLLAVHGLGVAAEDPEGPVATLVARNVSTAEMLTAPSRFLADAAIRLGAEPDRIHVVPNAVDHSLFKPRPQIECRLALGLNPERHLAVYLGRAIPMKGPQELLDAARTLRRDEPNLQVAFVGTWSLDLPAESARWEDAPDAPVVLCEGVPKDDLPLWLCAADVVVVPSRYEGFGLVALEALACARPVVLSRTGGLPEVVPAHAGVFVEPGDSESLAEGIRTILADPDRSAAMAAGGPEIAARYSWDATAAHFADLYKELERRSRTA